MSKDLHLLSAAKAAHMIREGRITSVDLVSDCLKRIEDTDGQIKAWAHIDKDRALARAAEMDAIRKSGRAVGRLHGVPVGLKDIIDTKDVPTERGSRVFTGRVPDQNATVVDRLTEAGAVILGKTVTTEFAFMHPADTCNPHNPAHTPGGSSSGSAAAVAAFQVPLAIGTQTGGSVIRPASFCGTFGFKPTRGMISRRGVLETSPTLDQIGTFGRTLEDAGLLVDAIAGYDPADAGSFSRPRPCTQAGAVEEAPVQPDFIWLDMPYVRNLPEDAAQGFEAVREALGARVEVQEAAPELAGLAEVHRTIYHYEIVRALADIFSNHWDAVSDTVKPIVLAGRDISDAQYEDARAVMASADAFFADLFLDFDAVLTPASMGEAPLLGNGTGDPAPCVVWTLAGLPCVTLPLLVGDTGLPVGVQLVGGIERDDRLLRTANWLINELGQTA